MKVNYIIAWAIASTAMIAGCRKNESASNDQSAANSRSNSAIMASLSNSVPLGSAANFAVLAGTTVTSSGSTVINGDLGVSPGTAITGFEPSPLNTITGPGTVTSGLGIVNGTIYAGGAVAAQAHNDAVTAYNYLIAQTPDTTYAGVTQLDGMTFTPGIYSFAPSANLKVNGTVYLDFQGNNDALFIFQLGSTLVTMAGSKVVALNSSNEPCAGANVFWAVGSSATINGAEFIGNVIANTAVTMTSGSNVSGRIFALNASVTLISNQISVCDCTCDHIICRDFVTGGGWITGISGSKKEKANFGLSGGIRHGEYWGQLNFHDESKNGQHIKSTEITGYTYIDATTRQINGIATIDGKGSYKFTLIVSDNGEPGTNDKFSLAVSNGYTISGTLQGGNIQLHKKCGDDKNNKDKGEDYEDKNEKKGKTACGCGS